MKRTRNRKNEAESNNKSNREKEKEMSENIPNCKREFEEPSSSSISPRKKTKLYDSSSDSHDDVIAVSSSSSSVASASDECSDTSAGEENDQCSSISSGCFSSVISKEISMNCSTPIVDLEAHQISKTEIKTSTTITNDFRKETCPMSEEGLGETTTEMESLTSATERKDNRRKAAEVRKTPTSAEIEEFFSEVENEDKQKQFIEKYNFDILNDKPLQGRYMWDRLY